MLSIRLICIIFPFVPSLAPSFAHIGQLEASVAEEIRIPLGTDAILSCSLPDDASSPHSQIQMRWLRDEDESVLSLNNRILGMHQRYSVSFDDLSYKLHIKQVKESDRGCYVCQIDSHPKQEHATCIDILVSPYIEETSRDMTVEEGHTVWLECKARGHPQPSVTWAREDNHPIDQGYILNGSVLVIDHIRMEESGAYLCIASNNVPPTVSKRVIITVNFMPQVRLEETSVGCEEGRDVRLVCNCYASPRPQIFWFFKNILISHSLKYSLDREVSENFVSSGLRLRSVTSNDYGFYSCFCNNTMGQRVNSVHLYRISSTTTHPDYSAIWRKHYHINDEDIAVTEIIDNSLECMTSAQASIHVTSDDSLTKHHNQENSSATIHHHSLFIILVILLTIH